MAAIVVVIGIALALGFSPAASAADWAAAFGLLTLSAFAVIWLSTALGMVTKSVETASNLPMPLFLLPFLGSGFVPADSMSGGLQWFAEYQPFTPIMDTLRGLLLGTAIGSDGVLAVLWCLAIALVGYLWAKRLYERDPTP
jgi:ABC-2 type transport system permease protein